MAVNIKRWPYMRSERIVQFCRPAGFLWMDVRVCRRVLARLGYVVAPCVGE